MADPTTLADVLTHPGTVAGGTGLTLTAFLRWLQGREAREARDQLIELRHDVKQLVQSMGKMENFGERIAILERDLKTLHERMSDYDGGRRRERRK